MRRDSRIDAHHRSSEIAWDETMLGCMVSSSVSVTAAAHLSPLVDYADLDGNLLISNDFDCGVEVQQGKLILPWGLDWAGKRFNFLPVVQAYPYFGAGR
jgi:hypothetical protein